MIISDIPSKNILYSGLTTSTVVTLMTKQSNFISRYQNGHRVFHNMVEVLFLKDRIICFGRLYYYTITTSFSRRTDQCRYPEAQ